MELEGTKSLCVCCLHYDSFIDPGLYEDYQDIIEMISHAYKIPQKARIPLFVCWLCKSMLAKVKRFKQQVEESLCMLEHHLLQEMEHPDQLQLRSINHSNQLGISDVELVSVQPEYNDKWDEEKTNQKDSEELFSDSIKVENVEADGVSERIILKNEVSCDEAQTVCEAVSNHSGDESGEQKDSIVGRSQTARDGRVVRVIISAVQLAAERERAARSPRYLALPHKCHSCLLGFEHEDTLRYHQRLRHAQGERRLTCETCQATLSSAGSYRLHQYRHTVRFECTRCGKRAISKHTILRHYDEKHLKPATGSTAPHADPANATMAAFPATSYTCDICNHTAKSYRAYRYHKEKHRQRPQCAHCGNTFINESGLRRHIRVVHGVESQRYLECAECGRRYKSRSGLVTHLHSHEAGAGAASSQLYCAPCRTHFKTRHTLAAHLATSRAHLTPRDYKYTCEECDRRFLHKRQLVRHIQWQHLNSTEHVCELCHKRFPDGRCLRRHRDAVHEKRRPPRDKICQYCARAFTTERYLETHIRCHTGERPLSCDVCGSTFAHPGALYRHRQLVHKLGATRDTRAPRTTTTTTTNAAAINI